MAKEKFELEFIVNASPKIIYQCLSTPSGLSEWFADDVNIRDDVFTFMWEGAEEKARIITRKKDDYVKYQWMEDVEAGEKTFFEIRIHIDPLTKQLALLVTDFAEPDEVEDAKMLWSSQIDELKHILGG
ncbi:MAG: SRPBCC domain-containing protein [Flavobacteriales bacterium]|nr:SRPBCC domain-containing protein [Flavobacteriales bacterium]